MIRNGARVKYPTFVFLRKHVPVDKILKYKLFIREQTSKKVYDIQYLSFDATIFYLSKQDNRLQAL